MVPYPATGTHSASCTGPVRGGLTSVLPARSVTQKTPLARGVPGQGGSDAVSMLHDPDQHPGQRDVAEFQRGTEAKAVPEVRAPVYHLRTAV